MVAAPSSSPRRRRSHHSPGSIVTRLPPPPASPGGAAPPGKHAPRAWKVASLLGVGFVFHLVYILSIFDIYFRSPLVHGIEPVQPSAEAPARRLVLFVGILPGTA